MCIRDSFKALANDKCAGDAIFNWTYADEQAAKRNWQDVYKRQAMEKVTSDGVITIEENKTTAETYNEIVEGMQFDRGYLTPYMVKMCIRDRCRK